MVMQEETAEERPSPAAFNFLPTGAELGHRNTFGRTLLRLISKSFYLNNRQIDLR